MTKKLAIYGGNPVITKPFKKYQTIGKEEELAVLNVLKKGELSKFVASKGEDFLGGNMVKKFEKNWATYFGVKYAIAVNSWTSGLIAAVGSLDIEPGDEVIVSPWTMSATATSIIVWNAIPVFADIDKKTFCLDPESVERNISSRTKAIMSVDIFGQSADMKKLKKIAKKYDLKIISDTAQAPGAMVNSRYAGTLADIGGFSLNYHKHINTGEGGMLVTNNKLFAKRMRLIRNHAEGVVGNKNKKELNNMIGYNFRLGEIEAAIGIEQLKKLKKAVNSRQRAAKKLASGIKALKGLTVPFIPKGNTHVYYVFPIILDVEKIKIDKPKIVGALKAEGVPTISIEYANLHLLPMYQKKVAYGKKNFPWSLNRRKINYKKGICPVAENFNDISYIGINMCLYNYSDNVL